MHDLELMEVRVGADGTSPVVVLRDVQGGRLLPIWMSAGGAAAIVSATDAVDERRPCVHDLSAQLTALIADGSSEVRITDYEQGQFFAVLMLGERTIPVRPSDGIALALRLHCPIRCESAVLLEAGVTASPQDEVEQFREFLDNVSPDDFQPPETDEP